MCRWAPDTETKIPTEPVPVGVAYWPRGCIACRAGQPRYHNLGTLKVEGNLEIIAGSGHTVDRVTRTWLCRCGHSGNKPYCDGTHKKIGFVA